MTVPADGSHVAGRNIVSATAPSGWHDRRSIGALAILCLIGLVNYIDRVALSVLQVPIKADLELSDAQIGIIIGFAFFVPYTLLSLPMARLADRYNRKYLMLGALLVWTGMTAAIGLADSFIVLLVMRMGVAVGEACCLPTSYSLLADYFRPAERGRAIAIFGTAFPIGSMIGMVGAGILATSLGWQTAFLVIGGGGLLLVPLMAFAFREPARDGGSSQSAPPPLRQTFAIFWRLRTFRYCVVALAFQSVVSISLLTWSAPFYTRVHGMSLSQASLVLGVFIGGAGGLGTFMGGVIGDWLAGRDRRWLLWLPAIGGVLSVPLALGQFLVADATLSVALGMAGGFLANLYLAPTYAVAQTLVGSNLRAFSAAAMVTAAAIVGGAIGPWGTGALSDFLAAHYGLGDGSLGFAICASLVIAAPIAVWAYMRAAAHLVTEATGFDAVPQPLS